MATVPLSGTNVRLVSGVPFNNDYKHTRWFDTLDQQTAWMQALSVVYVASQHNYQRKDGKTWISVKQNIDALWGANYLMFQNASYNNKWFYAFVTDLEYINDQTTYVHFEIDVLQSWMFDMTFKPSYTLREHMTLWNPDGSPVTHHLDEGLNYGDEYDIVSVQQLLPYNGVFYLVAVSTAPMHTGTTANTVKAMYNGGVTPLNYYIHPFRFDTSIVGTSLGAVSQVTDFLTQLYTDSNAVNNVVSLYITDYIGFNIPYDSGSDTITINTPPFQLVTIGSATTIYYTGSAQYEPQVNDMGGIWDGFAGYDQVSEGKLLMWPYCVISLEDFRGNRIDFKPEYIYDANNHIQVTVRGSLGVSNKVAYTIDSYNAATLSTSDQQTVSLEQGLIDNNPNDVPIINSYLSAYLQGNKNSLNNKFTSMEFNGVMNALSSGLGVVTAAATGNMVGSAASGINMAKGVGNDLLSLQGVNAKLKDISNHPPTLSSMGGNTYFDYGNKYQGVYLVKRQIKKEFRDRLTDFFNMFGYKSNHVKVPNFHTRQNWNFVQTQNAFITGNFNNDDESALREVFNNGITLWHTDDIGNYSLSNGVIA